MFGGAGGMFGGGFGMAAGAPGGQFIQKFTAYPPSFMERENRQVEEGDKIIMPTSCLEILARLRIQYPMLFEVTNELAQGRRTHCGVLEFVAPEGHIYLPHWMMSNLFLEPGDKVTIKSVSLEKGKFVKFRPQKKEFLEIANPKATLENKLRGFSALTTGDTIVIRHAGKEYALDIMEVRPGKAMTIIETDVNVDFAPPLDHEEGLIGAEAQAERSAMEAAKAAEAAPAVETPMETESGFAAFQGGGFSLSGKLAPSTGDGVVHTYEKRAKPIDMCKGGMSAPPTSSERPQGPEEADSSDEEGTESFAGKTFHAFGGTGWR